MNNCSLRYAKGFTRWMHLWDEKLTVKQKAIDISKELRDMGYKLLRASDTQEEQEEVFLGSINGE